ncbi:MAG: hypothetical protein DYG89_29325 [Caldilinea sp. CFX5]|nr:hypothetical protein [Caldilinea sp. CFX5]
MTTNPLSPDTMPPDEQTQADQTDRLITQLQQGSALIDLPDATPQPALLVDALVQMAADTTPTPAFVTALEARLQKLSTGTQAEQPRRRRYFFPFRRLAVAAALVLAVSSALFLTPAARATLWDWLYGFGLLDEAQVTEQAIPLVTPVAPAPTPLPLSALQEQAPFAFRPPTWLPLGLRYTGGFVMPGADGVVVTLAYHLTDPPVGGYALDAPLLFVAISDGPIPNRPLVAAGYQQIVRIGNHTGVYTHGNWREMVATTDETTGTASPTTTLVWDSALDATWLTWQADGLNYLLYAQGLQTDAEDLTVVAASMQ